MTLFSILLILLGALLMLLPYVAIFFVVYFILKLPLRRQERAGFFIDLLETGMGTGRSPEASIISFSDSRDKSMGVRFHLLAAHLESGLRLNQALEKVSHFLPPRLQAMLKVGDEAGELRKIIPLCRRMLNDGVSQTQSAINYLVLLVLVFTPLVPLPLIALRIFVLPKWREIFAGLGLNVLPPAAAFILSDTFWFTLVQCIIPIVLYAAAIVYIGGPRLSVFFKRHFGITVFDRLAFCLPWKRKRMQRDFTAVLAALLDSEIPEAKAVQLAAESTANEIFIERAQRVVQELSGGKPLAKALELFDGTGELRWRFLNGSAGRQGFTAALGGWIEALDAKAFQQEQSGAQIVTTGLVLLNGLIIGVVVIGLFQALVSLLNQAVLW